MWRQINLQDEMKRGGEEEGGERKKEDRRERREKERSGREDRRVFRGSSVYSFTLA